MIGEQQGTKKLSRHQTVESLHNCHICFFLVINKSSTSMKMLDFNR
jgi:hypothetical protein